MAKNLNFGFQSLIWHLKFELWTYEKYPSCLPHRYKGKMRLRSYVYHEFHHGVNIRGNLFKLPSGVHGRQKNR